MYYFCDPIVTPEKWVIYFCERDQKTVRGHIFVMELAHMMERVEIPRLWTVPPSLLVLKARSTFSGIPRSLARRCSNTLVRTERQKQRYLIPGDPFVLELNLCLCTLSQTEPRLSFPETTHATISLDIIFCACQ